jgi:hypothetical protein
MDAVASRGSDSTETRAPRRPAIRTKPIKATIEIDPTLLRRVKIWAGRRVLSVTVVVRALVGELVEVDEIGDRIAGRLLNETDKTAKGPRRSAPAGAPASLVKTTYDLEPGLYGDLHDWIARHDATQSAAIRLLMHELLSDPDLARRVEQRIAAAS